MAILKQQLSVYVIKDPSFERGLEISEYLYDSIYRNIERQTIIRSSVPVYYTDSKEIDENLLDIDFEGSEKIAIVLLVDANMYISNKRVWEGYIKGLSEKEKTSDDNIRIIPVAFHKNALRSFNYINEINAVRVYEHVTKQEKYIDLVIKHELCRMLYGIERASQGGKTNDTTPPAVRMFLSHTKRDTFGEEKAIAVKRYIDEKVPGISDFFDVVDIEPGTKFEEEIKKGIKESSILVVFHTDKYTESEWCKEEVLTAKKNDLPILIVDCLENGEVRAFPYMGNARNVRLNTEEIATFCEDVVVNALSVVLEKESHCRETENILKGRKDVSVVRNAPELMVKHEKNFVVYPEPPIGRFEYELLTESMDSKFVTPIRLAAAIKNLDFKGMKVAISVSESSDTNRKGITNNHTNALALELSRYLICHNAEIIYGGNINYDRNKNFTETIVEAFEDYNLKVDDSNHEKKLVNYVASYLADSISLSQKEDKSNVIEFIECRNSSSGNKSDDLTIMREQMNADMDARVVIGGKITGYLGKCPGVLEEILLALQYKKPIYITGVYGGVSSMVANYFKSEDINQVSIPESVELKKYRINDLNNGLTKEENIRLFETRNIIEIISLILTGLSRIKDCKAI